MLDFSECEKRRQRIKKMVGNLSSQDLQFIDSRIMGNLKNRLRQWAAQEWWTLFGSQGQTLDTLEDESRFIASLDKAFIFPAPSSLLNEPTHDRQEYAATEITKRGVRQKVEFYAPPVGRLLELMLYGFFDFGGRWVFLHRTNQLPRDEKTPQQWHVLEEDAEPSDRLGVRVTVNADSYGRYHHPAPNAVFSSLPTTSKEYAAVIYGSSETPGTHQEWMESLADKLCGNSFHSRPPIYLELAGEYSMDGYPLADFIAQGKHVGRKRAEPINGNHLDCRPENLRIRSSLGRQMKCTVCKKPTNADISRRVKDSLGSSTRICIVCIKDRP